MSHPTGRLAPSPTGAQHVGNARTYLAAWLSARSLGGRVVLRIEDIDSPRVKPGAAEQAAADLRWLGLDWDGEPVVQTARLPLYQAALDRLEQLDLVYPCTCTRSDVAAAASAPHAGHEPPPYPGTCAGRTPADADALAAAGTPFAWRFRVAGDAVGRDGGAGSAPPGSSSPPPPLVGEVAGAAPAARRVGGIAGAPDPPHPPRDFVPAATSPTRGEVRTGRPVIEDPAPAARTTTGDASPVFVDRYAGEVRIDLREVGGDFVVWKAAGTPAYQLAVVVDDAAGGVTEVVRGDDLIPSTPRQLLLYRALGYTPPAFAHVPLVVGEDGRRLAKRHGDTRLAALRAAGVTPEALVGLLAWSCGWQDEVKPVAAAELLPRFRLDAIPKGPFVLTAELLKAIGYDPGDRGRESDGGGTSPRRGVRE